MDSDIPKVAPGDVDLRHLGPTSLSRLGIEIATIEVQASSRRRAIAIVLKDHPAVRQIRAIRANDASNGSGFVLEVYQKTNGQTD